MIWCVIYLKFRGVWFGFSLKLKEYKFNKSAFVLKVCPLIFENITNCKLNFINRELELITIWPSQKIPQFFNNLRFRGGDLLFTYLLLTLNSIEYNLLLTSNKGRLICYCPSLWEGHKLLLTDYITCLYARHIVANEGPTWKKYI